MAADSHLPDFDRIARTVETCIAYAAKSDRPFQQATDLIVMLRSTPGWTDAEIFEVQGRITDALLQHARQNQSGSDSATG
jgi:hypothetical protein